MDIDNLTEEQAAQIYMAITGGDKAFLKAMARAAIQTSLDMQIDMEEELPAHERSVPNTEDVHARAASYTDDCIQEFKEEINRAISETKFEVVTMVQFK